jgi:hypothetical protein
MFNVVCIPKKWSWWVGGAIFDTPQHFLLLFGLFRRRLKHAQRETKEFPCDARRDTIKTFRIESPPKPLGKSPNKLIATQARTDRQTNAMREEYTD